MIRRILRLVVIAAVAAVAAAAAKAFTRRDDPLPEAPTPDGARWPLLDPGTDVATDVDRATAAAGAPVARPGAVGTAATGPAAADDDEIDVTDGSWRRPGPDGSCPDGYEIKAKLSSKIYHSPGQLHYDRTVPDRCYPDSAAAEADGLRAAKR